MVNAEVVFKRYQFTDSEDTCLIAEVDLFKREIRIKYPIIWRVIELKTDYYYKWQALKREAIFHLQKQYGFEKII